MPGDKKDSKDNGGLFGESIILGTGQIARSRGWIRRIKIAIFCLCTLGFLYHINNFLLLYFAYTTMMNIEIEQPDRILGPALTVCTRGWLKKSVLCEKYPKKCKGTSSGDSEDLDNFEKDILTSITQEELLDISTEWRETLIYQNLQWNGKSFLKEDNVADFRIQNSHGERVPCIIFNHNLNGLEKNTSFPSKQWDLEFALRSFATVGLFFNDSEFMKEDDHILYLALHSPVEMVNPHATGFLIDFFDSVMIKFKLTEIHLLEHPYNTDCFDYLESLARTGTGPASQKVCQQECIHQKTLESCQCTLAYVLYPNKERFCEQNDTSCLDEVDVGECYEKCKRDCTMFQYEVSIVDRQTENPFVLVNNFIDIFLDKPLEFELDFFKYPASDFAKLGIVSASTEKMTYRYKPSYEFIEVFSYVGGYLGIWLGLAVPGMLDLLKVAVLWKRKEPKPPLSRSNDGGKEEGTFVSLASRCGERENNLGKKIKRRE